MQVFSFKDYVPSLSEKSKAEDIYQSIQELNPLSNVIVIDLANMDAMTTICARLIFGRLFIELGESKFYSNIQFKQETASEVILSVIQWGIQSAIDEKRRNG